VRNVRFFATVLGIGGDTHTAGTARDSAPLRMLGQQPIQNAAPAQTVFV